ncbi:MAG: hypothetical protein WAO52_04440 [Prolixibacteraceae bacterium]
MEIGYLQGAKSNEIVIGHNEIDSWSVFQLGGLKLIFAVGLSLDNESNDGLNYSMDSFAKIQTIQEAEGMTFSDIVRQWNYIEQITGNLGKNGQVSQH